MWTLPIIRLLELVGAVRKNPVEVPEKPVGVEELEVIRVNDKERERSNNLRHHITPASQQVLCIVGRDN